MRKFCLYILLSFIGTSAMSQRNYHNLISLISIHGTSNLHDWKSVAKDAKVNMVMTIDSGNLKAIQYLRVEVDVKDIKSSKGSIMDNNTYIALNEENHPSIIYKLEKVNSLVKKGESYVISTTGFLSVAGVIKKIDLEVFGDIKDNGCIRFRFAKKIKMTDFKVKLPSILFGLIKTGNEVELRFDLIVKQT